jgi:hypothetical protein
MNRVFLVSDMKKSKYATSEVVKFKVTLGAVRKSDGHEIRREHSYVKDAPPPDLYFRHTTCS